MTNHPITPSPELIKDWRDEWDESDQIVHSAYTHIAIRAAQWGYDKRGEVNEAKLQKARDEELEACCEWLIAWDTCEGEKLASFLREGRRPKPPSLKEQALRAAHIEVDPQGKNGSLIIRALEALPND